MACHSDDREADSVMATHARALPSGGQGVPLSGAPLYRRGRPASTWKIEVKPV